MQTACICTNKCMLFTNLAFSQQNHCPASADMLTQPVQIPPFVAFVKCTDNASLQAARRCNEGPSWESTKCMVRVAVSNVAYMSMGNLEVPNARHTSSWLREVLCCTEQISCSSMTTHLQLIAKSFIVEKECRLGGQQAVIGCYPCWCDASTDWLPLNSSSSFGGDTSAPHCECQ
jgi:hypothetical protein